MRLDYLAHLASVAVIKLSIAIYAPLKKSPNYASQIDKLLGFSKLYPYSYESTPASESGLFAICNFPFIVDSENSLIGFHSYSVF